MILKKTNWQTKKLGDEKAFSVDYGTRVVKKRDGGSIYDVYGGGGKTFFMDSFNREDQLVIARFAMSEKCTRFVKGKFFLNDSGLTVSVKNRKEIYQNFLNYYFIFLNDYIYSLARGSAQKNLDVPAFRNIEIFYPKSLSEQKRIVKILDEVFGDVKKAKENAERNLANAKELFESYLQSVFENSGKDFSSAKATADKWEEKKLGEVCEIKPPKKEAKEKLNESDLVSFLPMADLGVSQKDVIAKQDRKLKDVSGSYTYFADDDVLLAKITPCFENGKLGIACNLKNGIGFGSSEYIVFRSNGEVIPDYLYYYLARGQFRKEGAERMSGAVGHKRISKEFIKESFLPFPKSLITQKQIVKKLDALSEQTKKLEVVYQQKIDDLEELKKSVLKKAFDGKL